MLTLLEHPLSSYVQKVKIALREKGVPFTAEIPPELGARMGDMAAAYASGERRREYRDHRLEWMVKSGGIDIVLAGLRDNTIRFPWPDPASERR